MSMFWLVVLEALTSALLVALFGVLYRFIKTALLREQARRDVLTDLVARVGVLENARG